MKSMLTGENYEKTEKGITLIALVVTIIVLLILAGVSIMMLTGQNGILKKAEEAKEKTIIGREKEEIMLAYQTVLTAKVDGNINLKVTSGDLEAVLLRESEEVAVTRLIDGTIKVLFTKTGHCYKIDNNKNITDPFEDTGPEETVKVNISLAREGRKININGENIDANYLERYERWLSPGTILDLKDKKQWEELKIDFIDNFNPQFLQSALTNWAQEQEVKIPENNTSDMYWIEIWETDWYKGNTGETDPNADPDIEEQTKTADDMAGENLRKHQGEYVDIGLDINNTDTTDDWRIFYVGNESGENRIFLIAADFVPVEKLDSWKITGTKLKDGYGLQLCNKVNFPYSIYWGKPYVDTPNIPWEGIPNEPVNFLKLVMHDKYDLTSCQSNNNSLAVAQLLNTNLWSPIMTNAKESEKIEFATGGPTLQMWCAAWNNAIKGNTDGFVSMYANVNNHNSNGYYWGKDETTTNTSFIFMNGLNETLNDGGDKLRKDYSTFFLNSKSAVYGYWLASGTSGYRNNLILIGCIGTIDSQVFNYENCGVRPVICLKSNVQLKSKGTNKNGLTLYELL